MAGSRFFRDEEEEKKKQQQAASGTEKASQYAGVRSGKKGKVVTQEDWDKTQNIAKTRKALEKTKYTVTDRNWDKNKELDQRRYNARLARHAVGLKTEAEKQDEKPNKMRIDFKSIEDNEQAVHMAAALHGGAKQKFLKDYAKYSGQNKETLYALADKQHGLFSEPMSTQGKLKKIGLYTINGDEVDLETAGPDAIIQSICDIADEDKRKNAAKLFQSMTRDPDSRFYGFDAYSPDYSFRNSALLTEDDYKKYGEGLHGKFSPNEDKLEASLKTYAAEYAKLEAQGSYVLSQELPVLQAAFMQQMGVSEVPDIGKLRRMLETEASINATRQALAQQEEEEENRSFFDEAKAWWNRVVGSGKKETEDEEDEAEPERPPRPGETRVETQDYPARLVASTTSGAEAEEPDHTITGPVFPKEEETEEPEWLPGAQGAATKQTEITGPVWTPEDSNEATREKMIDAYVGYIAKGKGEQLDGKTSARFDEFARSSPEMRALFGILDANTGREARAGNSTTFAAVYGQTESLGPLGKYAERIHGKGFMGDLSDAAMSAIIDVVHKASTAALSREEIGMIEDGLTNRVTLYCQKNPDALAAIDEAVRFSDEQNKAARDQATVDYQQALADARKRLRTGCATDDDWTMASAATPVYSPADRHMDKSYGEMQVKLQQAFDASGEQAWAAYDAQLWGEEFSEGYDWFNQQTLQYLTESGLPADLTSEAAAYRRNELLCYMNEVLAEEHDKARLFGYGSVGEMWAATGTGTLEDIQAKAIAKYEADLTAEGEAPEESPEESPYKGTGEVSTGTMVGKSVATGVMSNAAEVTQALATAGVVMDTEAERFEVKDFYYRTGSFATAERRCRDDLYAMLDGGYFPDETVAAYVREYLDNGGVALDLGIMPSKLGWVVADMANEINQRLNDSLEWAYAHYTPGQGRASELIANTTSNTIDQLESVILQMPIMAVPQASGLGRFLMRTMAFSAAYGAPMFTEGVDVALQGGADLAGANLMGQSMVLAQAVSEMYTDTGIAANIAGAMGLTDMVAVGMENLGATPMRRWLRAAGVAAWETISGAFEEAGHDEFFGGIGKGMAQGATWKTLELTNGLTEMPNPSDILKIAGAALSGGKAAVGPTVSGMIENFGENFIASIPITLLSGFAAGTKDWKSTREVKKAAMTGKPEDVAAAGEAIIEDMSDPAKAAKIDAAATEARIGALASDLILHDTGEIGALMKRFHTTKEQADSHRKAYAKAHAANRAAYAAMVDAQAAVDEGGEFEVTLRVLAEAQEAFQQSTNNMDESWREYQQKAAESDALYEEANTKARAEASKQVQQERAALAQQAQAAQDVNAAEQNEADLRTMEIEAFIEETHRDAPDAEKEQLRKDLADSYDETIEPSDPKAWGGDQEGLTPEKRQNLLNAYRFMTSAKKLYNVPIRFARDTDVEFADGVADGLYDHDTGEVIVSRDATPDHIFRRVVMHELTHRTEGTTEYKNLADALIHLKFGDDTDAYERELDSVKRQYSEYYAGKNKKLKQGEAERELVARIAGEVLGGSKEFIDRFVDERPSVARWFADKLKAIIDKLRGVKGGEEITKIRNVEKMFRKALKEAKTKGRAQQAVQPNLNMDEAIRVLDEYEGGANELPVAQDIVDRVVSELKGRENVSFALPSADASRREFAAWRAGRGERQFATQTAQRSEMMPEWMKAELYNNPNSRFYDRDSNPAQLMRGYSRIQQDGYIETRDRLLQVNRMEPEDTAAANLLMMIANHNGDVETMMLMAHKYNSDGTLLGKGLQARKLFSSMTPTALKMKMAGKYEAMTAEYMRTHKSHTKAIKARAAVIAAKIAPMAGEDTLLELARGNYSALEGDRGNKWGVPINDRQRALIKQYKLEGEARPGIHYNRATTKQRMLEAILATPDPLAQTGLGLNLVERLEMMNRGLAVVTMADLDYIERNMRTYCSLADETDTEISRAGDLALSRVYEAYGNVDPATFSEKLKTWGYVAMLTSAPSAARNFVGNASMNAVSGVADGVAVTLDQIVSLATKERTRAHLTLKQRSEGWWAFAEETVNTFKDFFTDKAIARHGNEKFNLNERGRVYQHQMPEALRLLEGFLMSVGDRNFWKKKYFNSISEQMNLARINGTEFDYEAAAEIAIGEANYATFTEDSIVIHALSMLKNSGGLVGWGTHFLMPFTGVPTNIMSRPLQYSPANLVLPFLKAIKDRASHEDFDQRTFVDSLSKGLTGTAILALGMELLRSGILHLGTSEDEDDLYYLNTAQGEQYTAFLQIGDKNISLSTFSPAASALITGGYLARALDHNETWYSAIASACLESYDTILEASYLSNLADVMKAFDEDGISGAAMSLAASAVSMHIPAALGQLADHFDPYTRDTKDADALKALYNSVLNRIPFARENLPAKVDITGQKVESKPAWSVFWQPLTMTDVRNDETLSELERIWRDVDDSIKIPGYLIPNSGSFKISKTVAGEMPGMDYEAGDHKLTLTGEQRVKYNMMYGQKMFAAIAEVMSSVDYQYGDDQTKAQLLSNLSKTNGVYTNIKREVERQICIDLGYDF